MTLTEKLMQPMLYSHLLALMMSELNLMRCDKNRDRYIEPSPQEEAARWNFGTLDNAIQLQAIRWINGHTGPGAEWDNRRRDMNGRTKR